MSHGRPGQSRPRAPAYRGAWETNSCTSKVPSVGRHAGQKPQWPRQWLDQELALLQPAVLVCLGATATNALMGSRVRVTRDRGRLMEWGGMQALVTVHPSSILRAPDPEQRREEMGSFVNDLQVVASILRR
jgi:uracil-DNA glycosylase family 4